MRRSQGDGRDGAADDGQMHESRLRGTRRTSLVKCLKGSIAGGSCRRLAVGIACVTAMAAAMAPLDADGAEASIRINRNITYARLSSAQKLDLYRPANGHAALPLVIYIHGGGFRFGDKSGAQNLIDPLLKAGFAVASLDYRLTDQARFPAQVEDVKAAVRFLRAHAHAFGLNPGRFAAFGGSAGGYLATMLGVSAGNRAFAGVGLGYAHTSSAVQAVAEWFGPVDFLTIDTQRRSSPVCANAPPAARSVAGHNLFGVAPATVPARAIAANPITYLSTGRAIPPFLIGHGTADCRVPYQQSLELYRSLVRSGHAATTSISIVAGAGHGPRFGTVAQMPSVVRFLQRTLGTASRVS